MARFPPYSKFNVGAALLTKSGEIMLAEANVESASYEFDLLRGTSGSF